MTGNKTNKRKLGSKYEDEAVNYLTSIGYSIICRNFRVRGGEIDIVAQDGEVLVFAEVKYRSAKTAGRAAEAVDYRKQVQISKMAAYYMTRYGVPMSAPIRFDVIAFDADSGFEHIKNAFSYCWRV